MKKIFGVFIVAMTIMSVMGCASSQSAAPVSRGDVPEWFVNPPAYEGAIVGFGISTSQDRATALTQSETRARVAIAQTLSATVDAMVTDYIKSTGSGESERNMNFFESISRTITTQRISGTTIKDRHFAQDGTTYALAVLNAADAKKMVADVASTQGSIAELNAMNALQRLDEQIAKHDSSLIQTVR
ncbi:hypothetical protein FACS1894172_21600 [Spirochaetia bacterium]|nr:hypothetical protein FACS1894172_21600 [Spirochaetia bacterium]